MRKDKQAKAGITLIANNCQVMGDIHFSDELAVSGIIKGNITAEPGSKARIRVYENGRIEGDITVPNVIINGAVKGNIYSDKHVELAARAHILGDIHYNLIEMVAGSQVDGNLLYTKPGDSRDDTGPRQAKQPRQSTDKAATKHKGIKIGEHDAASQPVVTGAIQPGAQR